MHADAIEQLKKDFCEFAGESWEAMTDVEEGSWLTVGDINVEPENLLEMFDSPTDADEFKVGEFVVVPTNSIGSDCSCEVIATYGLEKVKEISQSLVVVLVYAKTKDEAYFIFGEQTVGFTLYKV